MIIYIACLDIRHYSPSEYLVAVIVVDIFKYFESCTSFDVKGFYRMRKQTTSVPYFNYLQEKKKLSSALNNPTKFDMP